MLNVIRIAIAVVLCLGALVNGLSAITEDGSKGPGSAGARSLLGFTIAVSQVVGAWYVWP